MKTLAQRIQDGQAALNATRDKLTEATKSLDTATEPADIDAVTMLVDQLTTQAETELKSLEALQRAEKILAGRAAAAAANDDTSGGAAAIVTSHPRVPKERAADLLIRSMLIAFEAHHTQQPAEIVLERRYPGDEATKAVALRLVTKGAQTPAMTSVAGWAAELTRISYAAFIDLLAPMAVIPRMPMRRYDFGGFAKISIPMRAGRNATGLPTPNLAAEFRSEGDPIRVGAMRTQALDLTPKSLGVIGEFTLELLKRSTPDIESVIRDAMLRDTGIKLDLVFLGAAPGTAKQPPGMQSLATGANTRPSTGNTVAQMTADVRAMAQQMAATGNGVSPVWVMNPARAIGLELALTAAGTLAFPTMANDRLLGYPVVRSLNCPADVVFLIDADAIPFAGDAPTFAGSTEATLHEEDTAPLPIASPGAPATVAAPTRSLFQTNSAALRGVWEVDWNTIAAGAVQTLTAVAW